MFALAELSIVLSGLQTCCSVDRLPSFMFSLLGLCAEILSLSNSAELATIDKTLCQGV